MAAEAAADTETVIQTAVAADAAATAAVAAVTTADAAAAATAAAAVPEKHSRGGTPTVPLLYH